MFIRRKLLPVLSISLLLTSCGGGGNNTPGTPDPDPVEPIVEVPVGNLPDGLIHAPLSYEEPSHSFYNVKILPDGRLIGHASIETSEKNRAFSTGPTDFSRATPLTPKPVRYDDFSYSANRTVYIEDNVLYSKDLTAPLQLSGSEKVDRFWLSPDQTKVLYIANTSVTTSIDPNTQKTIYHIRNELYISDVTGGNRVNLSIADANSKVIYDSSAYPYVAHNQRPQFLPGTSRIVYLVTLDSTGLTELHSVLADGSGRVTLNANIDITDHEGDHSFVFDFTHNASHVIYGVRNAGIMELYSIKPDGSANTKISGTLVAGGSVIAGSSNFTVTTSPDNGYVIYLADAETDGTNELYRVALDGTDLTKLSNGQSVSANITTLVDSNTLVYASDDLYAVSTAGGSPTKLTTGLNLQRILHLEPSIDKTAVVFVAIDITNAQNRLFISKLDGSSVIDITGPMIPQGNVYSLGSNFPYFILDPAGGRLVFSADAEVDFNYSIYSVNLDGSNRVRITPDRLHTSYTQSIMIGFSGSQFYFSYDKDFWTFTELYVYDFSNSTLNNLSANWPGFITEDYKAQSLVQSTNGAVQGFVSKTSAFRDAALIIRNPISSCRIELPENSYALARRGNYQIEATGHAIYYTVLNRAEENWRLYRASTNDCATTEIGSGINESLHRMGLSPDGQKVALTGYEGGLYITSTDGSVVKEVNSTRALGGIKGTNYGAFAFSHDSKNIIYWADQDTADVFELYSATVDGLTNHKINGPLINDGEAFLGGLDLQQAISPDDQWVVYPAQQDALIWELYKTKLDGSANTRISGELVNAEINIYGDGNAIQITADSTKVVYQIRDNTTNIVDLYSVNLNAAPSATKLTPTFTGNASVTPDSGVKLTSDSRSVVYVAKNTEGTSKELFSVKLDGTGLTKLNASLQADEYIEAFSLTKDGSKAVYITSNFNNGDLIGLYASNIDGSGSNLLVNPQPIDGSYSQTPPRLTGDNRVVFRATLNTIDGIYIMPVSGGTPSLVVEVPADRNLEEVFIANDGQIMVVGDLRLQGVFEVFNYNI